MYQERQQVIKKARKGISFLFAHLPKTEKWLHALILFWVLWQLLLSFGMHIQGDTPFGKITVIDKLHIYGGLGLFILTIIFFSTLLNRRKVADLYPWLSGNLHGLKSDLHTLLSRRLPDPTPGGLAATIEGLGLLALLLAVFTGLLWYSSISLGLSISPDLLAIHKTCVGAIELYFYGHGTFAFLHLLTWWLAKR
ncbi:hypothetical protein HWQ46_02280 [Shewanella sp. D64]|uniref:hypothetical protein n=1 Tax=unclassified Shewanella TaxID=196818 RepID=UPI0022BA3446|nr:MULTISPECIES: hypothetical protein [unclassified Shewanella]MEC4724375.1 hypothetical protein [Shewanella sp. D64]MEC4738887.1 hypothetical protein [Shewanella sp. E94]WBJ97676.1 hypothetical protein HWQ47_11575 [Shewanella sp. MTB7]